VKFNLEKFGRYLQEISTNFKECSSDIADALCSVSSELDLKIFIDNNRSSNQVFQKEEFQEYSKEHLDVIGRHRKRTGEGEGSDGTTQSSLQGEFTLINDNYIKE